MKLPDNTEEGISNTALAAFLYNEILSSTTNFYGLQPSFQRKWIALADEILLRLSINFIDGYKLGVEDGKSIGYNTFFNCFLEFMKKRGTNPSFLIDFGNEEGFMIYGGAEG